MATKGQVQLQVKLNNEVRVTPLISARELSSTSKAIVKGMSSILNFSFKDVPSRNKEVAIKKYLEGKGWHVEN